MGHCKGQLDAEGWREGGGWAQQLNKRHNSAQRAPSLPQFRTHQARVPPRQPPTAQHTQQAPCSAQPQQARTDLTASRAAGRSSTATPTTGSFLQKEGGRAGQGGGGVGGGVAGGWAGRHCLAGNGEALGWAGAGLPEWCRAGQGEDRSSSSSCRREGSTARHGTEQTSTPRHTAAQHGTAQRCALTSCKRPGWGCRRARGSQPAGGKMGRGVGVQASSCEVGTTTAWHGQGVAWARTPSWGYGPLGGYWEAGGPPRMCRGPAPSSWCRSAPGRRGSTRRAQS